MPGRGQARRRRWGRGSGGAHAGRCALDAQSEAWARWKRLVVRTLRLLKLEFLAGQGGALVKYWGLRAKAILLNLRKRARIQQHRCP